MLVFIENKQFGEVIIYDFWLIWVQKKQLVGESGESEGNRKLTRGESGNRKGESGNRKVGPGGNRGIGKGNRGIGKMTRGESGNRRRLGHFSSEILRGPVKL